MTELDEIKHIIFDTIGFQGDFEIETYSHDCIEATYENNKLCVGCSSKTELCRTISQAVMHIRKGEEKFCIRETCLIKQCGPMLDMSRNAVMRVESVKKYLNYVACMGLNIIMLYTEDTYEVKKYPYFGYMRGRYTLQELKEIDDYANSLGIEVIPCIQTLGHMANYLKWPAASEIKDTASVMLADEEKTYELIEECIKTMRSVFRSDAIHIGMDETHDLGLGKHLKKFGFENQYSIYMRHLNRVCDICKKYGYQPIMWGDIFFRFGSESGLYFDKECVIPDIVKQEIPDNVIVMYWDYYHSVQSHYDEFIEKHRQFNGKAAFAGGVWTWDGFLPDNRLTYQNTVPALNACLNHNIDMVLATMWGDSGCETDLFWGLGGLALFAEYRFKGKEASRESAADLAKNCTGFVLDELDRLSDFHKFDELYGFGRRYIWCDPLINAWGIGNQEDYQIFINAAAAIPQRQDKWELWYRFARQAFKTAAGKCKLLSELRARYLNADKEYLKETAEHTLPKLLEDYQQLQELHETLWLHTNKAYGWEVICAEYGGVTSRIKYSIKAIMRYLSGEAEQIEELEAEPILNSQIGSGKKISVSC